MNTQQMLAALTPDVIDRFKVAIETGKWPNGIPLTTEQRSTCLRAVILWDNAYLPVDDRIGYIDKGSKTSGDTCGTDDIHRNNNDDEQPVTIM